MRYRTLNFDIKANAKSSAQARSDMILRARGEALRATAPAWSYAQTALIAAAVGIVVSFFI